MKYIKNTQISLGLFAGAILTYIAGSALVSKGWSSIDLSEMHWNLFLLTGRHIGPASMDFGMLAAVGIPVLLLVLTAVFAAKAMRNSEKRMLSLITLTLSICLLGMIGIGIAIL